MNTYHEFVNKHKDVIYTVSINSIKCRDINHKYVGAQFCDNGVIGIPNEVTEVLQFDSIDSYWGHLEEGNFKWTGSGLWNEDLYCFPRASDKMLILHPSNKKISYWNCEYIYRKEHHYGGVLTPNGKIYQPPRSEQDIYVWDINKHSQYRIHIGDDSYRYCSSIFYPPDTIYFIPERNQKVIKFSILDDSFEYIGDNLLSCVYDAKIAIDGNIYGFSAREHGIIKIDVSNNNTEMLHTDIWPGAYGTKLGLNGKLYSIPGDGNHVWEYNPLTDELNSIYDFEPGIREKYAGGVTCPNGMIMGMPIKENSILQLTPNVETYIPDDVYNSYFADSY